jgi:hypothetical protein
MRTLILAVLAFASSAVGQIPETKALEGCWRNIDNDRSPGNHPMLCFGPEDVVVNFWTPSGGLDYAFYNWEILSGSTIGIGNVSCGYKIEGDNLSLSECGLRGIFKKN